MIDGATEKMRNDRMQTKGFPPTRPAEASPDVRQGRAARVQAGSYSDGPSFFREQASILGLPFDGIGARHPNVPRMPWSDSLHAIHSCYHLTRENRQ